MSMNVMSASASTGAMPASEIDATGTLAAVAAGGDMEGIATLDELMLKMAQLMKEMRDLQQDYSARQQEQNFTQHVAAVTEKRASIGKAYEAASGAAIAGIVGGALGLFGGAVGGAKGVEALTQLGSMAGKASDSIGQLVSAGQSREAQMMQVQGEFMSASADSYRSGMQKVMDAAIECSRLMRETTQQLVDLHARLTSAVKFG